MVQTFHESELLGTAGTLMANLDFLVLYWFVDSR